MNRIDPENHRKKMNQDLMAPKTDLRPTDEKLEQLKENFTKAFTACPAALAITRRADGRFLQINAAYTQIMGYAPEDILGRTADEMHIYVIPEERQMLMQQLQKKGFVRDHQLAVRSKSGDIQSLQVSIQPLVCDREPTLITACVDLTERNRAEAALRQNKEKMAFALETSGIGTWELDLADRSAPRRSLRHDQIFGYEKGISEWTYDIFLAHVHPEDRSHVNSIFNAAAAAYENWSFECRIYRADGDLRWIRAAGRHTTDASGNIQNMSGIVQDITAFKHTEMVLKQKTAELEEINTALNVMLKKREQDNQMLEEMLRKKIASGYESLILPLLDNLKNRISSKNQLFLVDILEKNLDEVFSPFAQKLSDPLLNLTPAEIQIAAMIKQGMTNKQIAGTLHKSIRTIDAHRAGIRRKLQIQNRKINLRAYLSTL